MKKTYIFHLDLDQFFAACHMIKEPYLRHTVFVVGSDQSHLNKGVVSTSSYSARRYEIKSGMTIIEAKRKYPKILIVPTDFKLYKHFSNLFFDYLFTFTNKIQIASIDEAYVDFTDYLETHKIEPLELAKQIQKHLMDAYKLPVSIGISETLYLAKIASDLDKPLGISTLYRAEIESKIYEMPLGKLYGFGKSTTAALQELEIYTLSDFIKKDNQRKLAELYRPQHLLEIMAAVSGHSKDFIEPYQTSVPKSMSREVTLNYAVDSLEAIIAKIKPIYADLAAQLKHFGLEAKTVNFKFKTTNFKTYTRAKTLMHYISSVFDIQNALGDFIKEKLEIDEPIRLFGVGLSNFREIKSKNGLNSGFFQAE